MELNKSYLCSKIGSGTYGNVYSVIFLNVAVKLVPLKDLSLIELDIMSRLRHSNIAQILDFGIFKLSKSDTFITKIDLDSKNIYDNNFGFVMERADENLKSFKYESKKEVLDIIEQIKNGLYYLHKNKIIHADIKPENILVYFNDGNINVKITDFGISKYSSNLKTKDTLANTIGYRPPEIVNKSTLEIDNSIDYWALGNIIYNMVTGIKTYYKDKGIYQDYFGDKTQEYIDNKIYNEFNKLGFEELINFTQKCLTVNQPNIRIPPEKCDKFDIGYNISIYKNNEVDIKTAIDILSSLNYKVGYDILLKILHFYIINYDNKENTIYLCKLLLEIYIKKIDMYSFTVVKNYIKIYNKLNECNGIINNYSLYDTPFRDIQKIESLNDYEFIFKYYLSI